MSSGGKRKGAGRKPGQKDRKPRTRVKALSKPKEKKVKIFEKFNKGFYFKIKPYLDKDKQSEYEALVDEGAEPVDCLKILIQDLMVRYKMGRIKEMTAGRTWDGISKVVDNIKQIAELIHRIEEDNPSLKVNILQILTDASQAENAAQLTHRLFEDPFKMDGVIDITPDKNKGDTDESVDGAESIQSDTSDESTQKDKKPKKKKRTKKKI